MPATRTHVACAVLAFALLAGPAGAATAAVQWESVAAGGDGKVEVDKSRIARLKGGQTAAWTRLTLDHPVLDFDSQVRYTAVQALNYYDCAHGSFATRERVFLIGDQVMKTEKVSGPQIQAQPHSFDARLLAEVCKPRTMGELQQTAARAAAAAADATERPHVMHAEMVSAAAEKQPQSVKVAEPKPAAAPAPATTAPVAEKPRLFEMPLIDKSKAEDPYKDAPPPAATAAPQAPAAAQKPAAAPPKPAAAPQRQPATVQTLPAQLHDLSRQQRELLLATSGPRKAKPKKAAPPPPPPPPPQPDYSHVHWGYAGLGAPENWAKIRPDYATCGTGTRQSPIDIRGGIKVDLEPIKFDYHPTQFRIIDNGHTIQVDVAEGSTITLTGHTYQLVQMHFHRPSEERVNGRGYDMVAHLVHKDFDGNIAVVAVLMEGGSDNPLIQTLWNYMPLEVGLPVEPPDVTIDLNKFLPARRDYYTYIGSLTTPPCTENVLWLVMKNPVPVSFQQIGIFSRLYPHNARPVQPSNDRLIKESR